MELLASRKQINPLVDFLQQEFEISDQRFFQALQNKVLDNKIPFPLLEYLTSRFLEKADPKYHLPIAVEIMKLRGMGRFVVCGQILRQRIKSDHLGAMTTALGFIRQGNEWRACDLISERVLGNSILLFPELTLSFFNSIIQSPTEWDKRAIGVSIHYSVKKGLQKYYSEQSFQILLSLSHDKEFHTKKGVGWAAKTISKFHPDLVLGYENQINEASKWFRTKIKMGKDYLEYKRSISQSPLLTSQA